MAYDTGTITGKFRLPNGLPRFLQVEVEALAVAGTVIAEDGSVISGKITGVRAEDGTLSVTLPLQVDPPDARWRATFTPVNRQGIARRDATAPAAVVFDQDQIVDGIGWDDLVDVSGVPVTASLLAQATAARDAAEAAADRAEASASALVLTRAGYAALDDPDPTQLYVVVEEF